MRRSRPLFVAAVFVCATASLAFAQPMRYFPKVQVKNVTRLDWLFPILHASPRDVPADIEARFHLSKANYQYFGPQRSVAPVPVVVFVSPSNKPTGWDSWRPICQKHGVAFVGVRNAGNSVSIDLRIRLVLEALGDVRRRINVDPDRTYLSGFSGGAQVASLIGSNVPEYFGGVICLGCRPLFPTEPSNLSRVAERLSLVAIYGAREPFAPIARLVSRPEFEAASIRFASHSQKGQGHVMPPTAVIERAFLWLEQDLNRRKDTAKRFPATRISDEPSRSEWATRVLTDAKLRLQGEEPGLGVEQLDMLVKRWGDVPAAEEAQTLLQSPTVLAIAQTGIRQRERTILTARANGFAELAISKNRRVSESRRVEFAKLALELVTQIGEQESVLTTPQLSELREISSRTVRSQELLVPLETAMFELSGEMSRWDSLNAFAKTLERLGYAVTIEAAVLEREPELRDQVFDFRLHAVSFETLSRRVLDPLALRLQRSGSRVRIRNALRKPPVDRE